MFDINFLDKPDLLEDNSKASNIRIKSKGTILNKSLNKNNYKRNKGNYFLAIISICLLFIILGSVLYNKKSNQQGKIVENNISIINFIDLLNQNDSNIAINYIEFTNYGIFFDLSIFEEILFYHLLDSFVNNFGKNIRGIHKDKYFSIRGKFPWNIEESIDFNVNLLNKELSDFNLNIKQEIYRDKLIVVSDIENMFKLLRLITELNLINKFHVEIRELQALPNQVKLFQVIIG